MTERIVEVHRSGVTRTVFLVGQWAIKVPSLRGLGIRQKGMRVASFCRGVLANQSELEWSSVEGVNPVVWSFRNVVNVYRRAEPVLSDEGLDYEALCPDFVPIGDRKPSNIGIVDGRVVWIDFDFSWNGNRCRRCAPST